MLPDQDHSAQNGIIKRAPDGYSIRFERRLSHPLEKVWKAITQPDILAKWLAVVTIDPTPGGEMTIAFTNSPSTSRGRITRISAPRLIEYTWQENNDLPSLVCWELKPDGRDGCILILTHSLLNNEIPSFGAGWHTHLDLLGEVLDGKRGQFSWNDQWWKNKLPGYEAALKVGD